MWQEEGLVINKERTWLFAPVNQVVCKVTIQGNLSFEELEAAIMEAASKQEILRCVVKMDTLGQAYFERGDKVFCQVIETDKKWEQLIHEEERKPMDIWKGEWIRFFVLPEEEGKTLVMIAHHLVGDGISYAYFLQDVMRALVNEKLSDRPIRLFAMSDLPKESELNFGMSMMMKWFNKRWQKTERLFDQNAFLEMSEQYWKEHQSIVVTHCFSGEAYDKLIARAKDNKVTINTVLATSFFKASGKKQSMGQAVSIREKGYEGMGNFATGISTDYKYDEKKNFWENAHVVQHLIQDKLNDPKKKYLLLQFLGKIKGTLQDAIYFQSCTDYEDKVAKIFSQMFGYNNNPQGISMTNLTKLPIKKQYGDYELKGYTFVPPLVLNSQRIIGVASLENEMVITCQLRQDVCLEENMKFFNEGIKILMEIENY